MDNGLNELVLLCIRNNINERNHNGIHHKQKQHNRTFATTKLIEDGIYLKQNVDKMKSMIDDVNADRVVIIWIMYRWQIYLKQIKVIFFFLKEICIGNNDFFFV
eukprot:192118_1